jgi:hypothetical protein
MRASIPLLLLGAISCGHLSTGAQNQFRVDYTCPADRIHVARRHDVPASSFLQAPSAPPPEVAADPGRLEEWKREQYAARSDTDSQYSVYDVDGCGHQARYACRWVADSDEDPSYPQCTRGGAALADQVKKLLGSAFASGTTSVQSTSVNVQLDATDGTIPDLSAMTALARAMPASLGLNISQTNNSGILVTGVEAGQACDGKLRVGDVIVGIDGTPVTTTTDVLQAFAKRSAGAPIVFDVTRGADRLSISVDVKP